MLTVVCVLVRGHVEFTPEYVIRLRSMCLRHAPSHRFVCVTDDPSTLPSDIETVRVPSPRGYFGWWSKLELFNRAHGFSGRMLYLDLDVLVVSDLTPVARYASDFALVPDGAPNFKPKDGRVVVKKFNSSVMVWDAGVADHLYEEWDRGVTTRLWGDQDWIGERAVADVMPIGWFPRLSECGKDWSSMAKVVLCKKPKNHIAAQQWEWFNEAWQ